VYLVTGGVVFAAVEAPEENAFRSGLVTARRIFLETHPCVTGMSEIVLSEVTVELLFDIFDIYIFNCNWVDTRWQ
jgi:hypothetical protein